MNSVKVVVERLHLKLGTELRGRQFMSLSFSLDYLSRKRHLVVFVPRAYGPNLVPVFESVFGIDANVVGSQDYPPMLMLKLNVFTAVS